MPATPYSYLLLLLPTAVLCCEDFRMRRVGIAWLLVLGAASAAAAGAVDDRTAVLRHAGCNIGLLVLLGVLLGGYLRLRGRRIGQAAGGGDAVFLLALTPLFTPDAYVRFLIAACLLALVWWAWLGCRRGRTIPFVGFGGIALGGWLFFQITESWLS